MPRPHVWYCQRMELFAGLSDQEMQEIIPGILHEEFKRNDIIYTPQNQTQRTYILKDGEVTLFSENDGKKVVIDILKPGAIFGNDNTGMSATEGVSAEASQRAFVCTLPRDFFLRLLRHRPDVAVRAFGILSRRIAQYQMQLQLLSSLDARERILATISLINRKDEQSVLPPLLRTPTSMTHQKLASMTGLTRETVSKQLKKLIDEGLVHAQKKQLHLTSAGRMAIADVIAT